MTEELEKLDGDDDIQDFYRLSRDQLVQRVVKLHGELKGLQEQLQIQQITDTLTGLANRDYFFASLSRLWRRAKRFGQVVCVLLIDVDNFRSINDRYGHLAGDLVLTGLADVFRSIVRDYDLLARFGEEEFALAIDNTDPQMARQLGQRIRKAVAETPVCASERIIPVTVTVGMTVGRPDLLGEKPEALIRSAIEATEIARRKGHNQFHALELAAAP